MRPILLGDLDVAARVLLAVPEPDRPARMARILVIADLADRYRMRTGRNHVSFGDGTLSAAARGRGPVAGRWASDRDYRAAFLCVLNELNRHEMAVRSARSIA